MEKDSFHKIRLVLVLAVVSCVAQAAAEEQPKGERLERRYQLGPLVAEDFRGPPPTDNGRPGKDFAAGVETAIKWLVRYRFDQVGKKFTLKLTEVDVYSAVYPYSSFNNRPNDRALLDHEQGHFDIAEIFALELRIKLTQQIRSGKPLTVTASSVREGSEQIDSELQKMLAESREAFAKRHQQYDEITNHGDNAEKQKLQRDEQKTQLKTLQEKMKELSGKK